MQYFFETHENKNDFFSKKLYCNSLKSITFVH
jgi:hypothetical protein